MIGILHAACMRSTRLPKPVLAVVLGCIVLSGCGAQNATADLTRAGGVVSASTPPEAPPSADDPELRFLALLTRTTQGCAPDAPDDSGKGDAPRPEDLPGWEGAPTPRYGPGETPPGVPNAEGDVPVPLPSDAPPPPRSTPSPAKPTSVEEVPLTGIEKCTGSEHAKRISEAFKGMRTVGYQEMRKKLMGLDYPASVIHAMPDHAGAPRARIDVRMMGSHVALEVTGTGNGVIAEAFGAPETEDVKVTEVKRKPSPDAPTS